MQIRAKADLERLLIILDNTVSKKGLKGYDPRLFWYLPGNKAYSKNPSFLNSVLRKMEVGMVNFLPFTIKPILNLFSIPTVVNQYGLGIALQAYTNYYDYFKNYKYLEKTVFIEEHLRNNLITFSDGSLGVPTPLENEYVSSLPAASEVATGYLDLFDLTNKQEYLDVANRIAQSFLKHHGQKNYSNSKLCLDYYSNKDGLHVLNANALAAYVLARLDTILSNTQYKDIAFKITNYVSSYMDSEKLPYSGIEDMGNKNVDQGTYDVYHTGFVVRSMDYLAHFFNMNELKHLTLYQYDLMKKNFISNGFIKTIQNRSYIDIHGVAEFINTAAEIKDKSKYTEEIVLKNTKHMYKDGTFFYRRNLINILLYMPRWGHFPMMNALSKYIKVLD